MLKNRKRSRESITFFHQTHNQMSFQHTLTIEELYKPEYLDPESLIGIASPWKLHCLTYGNNRIYWMWDEITDVPILFNGVSSFIDNALPNSIKGEKYMRNWAIDKFNSVDDYRQFMDVASAYGDLLHWQLKKFGSQKYIDPSELELDVTSFIDERNLSHNRYLYRWIDAAAEDLHSFSEFVKAYNVRILAIEFPIAGSWGVASRIDLICLIDIPLKKNGEPYSVYPKDTSKVENWLRDVLAIGDFKSKLYSANRGTFYPSNAFQVYAYRRLWNDAFAKINPKLKVDFVFNWSPAAEGRFNFRAWTDVHKETEDSAEFSFGDKICDPAMLDDIIAFNLKWFGEFSPKFSKIEFDRMTLGGENEVTFTDVIDFARRYRENQMSEGEPQTEDESEWEVGPNPKSE